MNFHPSGTQQYATNVLDAHQTQQYNSQPPLFGAPSHTILPTTPNDGNNAHWFSSNSQIHAKSMYEENNVILPPENKEQIEKRKATFIVVDSRSRNYTDYPKPNEYSIPLASEIRDVESIQMISYNIPKPQFPIRETNNIFYYTITAPSVVTLPDGGVLVELNKATTMQSFSIDPGHYSSTIGDYVPTATVHSDIVNFKNELDAYVDATTLKQDMFSVAFEKRLNKNINTTCMIYIEEHNEQYTILTNFSSPTADDDDCNEVSFFHPFFEGCEEFYGSTTIEKVNICESTKTTCSKTVCGEEEPAQVYSYEKCGKKQKTYIKNSIGEIIGHPHIDSQLQISGKGDNVTIDATTLTGIGTKFLSELRPGDWVYVYDHTSSVRRRIHIHEVNSDTDCTIDCTGDGTGAGPDPFQNAFMWVGRLTFPWARNLNPDYYIAMYMNNASTLQSYTQSVDRAFFLVPGKCPFYEIKQYLPYKKFTPTMGRLDKLDISFRNADNTLYDFKGQNHVLMFKVIHFRQNINYGDF